MDTKTEAELFITINHKQKSVPRSVLIALQSDLKWGSDDARERVGALSSALVKSLNSDPTSAFFQRFTIQGVAPKENQNLTMPEAVNGLVRSNVLGRIGKKYSRGYLSGITDDETIERARKILNGYFGALREANPDRWDAGRTSYVAINPGVRAHLLLIAEIIRYIQSKDPNFDVQTASDATVVANLTKIATPAFSFLATATDISLTEKFARKFGEGGPREYFFNLCEMVRSGFLDFGSAEFVAHLAKSRSGKLLSQRNRM